MKGSTEWWVPTARHMWRTFFALEKEDFDWDKLSEPNKKIYAFCQHIFMSRFVKADQDILRMYFTSRWSDDLYAVEDYSLKNNIPTKVIWIVIRRANRAIMEEIGLLEKKDSGTDEG